MCTTTFGTLTLASMLSDPLIQAMMRSDGVSEREHADLLYRVKDKLSERHARTDVSAKNQPELAL